MAKLGALPKEIAKDFTVDETLLRDNVLKAYQAQDIVFEKYQAISDALPEGTAKGGLVYFPWADGRAIYYVVKEEPLTLASVPYGDAWQVPATTLKGIRLADVLAQLKATRQLNALFSAKQQAKPREVR